MSPVCPTAMDKEMMRHALDWPKCWRNYYCAELGCLEAAAWARLVDHGFAVRGRIINDGRDQYFHVTDAGKAELTPSLTRGTDQLDRGPVEEGGS